MVWQDKFQELLEYKKEYGQCNVSYEKNQSLFQWVQQQRDDYIKANMSVERIKMLHGIGFNWHISEEDHWFVQLGQLQHYKSKHGHCNIKYNDENKPLYNWVQRQRTQYKQKIMSEERIKLLNGIGFKWTVRRKGNWYDKFKELKQYKSKHGDCNVHWDNENQPLADWVRIQRFQYKHSKLSEERINMLNAIGFNLTAPTIPKRKKKNSIIWFDTFKELQQYKSKNGNCKVPTLYEENQPLADWVQRQRAQYKLSTLSEERINMLNGIRFDWTVPINGFTTARKRKTITPVTYKTKKRLVEVALAVGNEINPEQEDSGLEQSHEQRAIESKIEATTKEKLAPPKDHKSAWKDKFEQLKQYKSKHGDCNVPATYKENQSLAYWVQNQRIQFKNSKLSDERINMLNAIGFDWTARYDKIWYDKFEALKLFKSKHGNCNVPRRYEDNQPLSNWVAKQRCRYKQFKLSEERMRLLNAAGFEWTATSKGRKAAPNRVGNETHPEQEDSQNTKQIKTFNGSAPATYKTKKRTVEVALAVRNEICPSSHPPSYANYNSYSQYQQPQHNKSAYHDYRQPYYGHQIAPPFIDEEYESLVQDVLSSFDVNDDNDDSSTSSIGSTKKENVPHFFNEEHESLVQDILSSFYVNGDDDDSSTSSIGSTKK